MTSSVGYTGQVVDRSQSHVFALSPGKGNSLAMPNSISRKYARVFSESEYSAKIFFVLKKVKKIKILLLTTDKS